MPKLFSRVAELPVLDRQTPYRAKCTCKVCGEQAILFDYVDFNKFCSPANYYRFGLSGINIAYYRCAACGFLFTPDFDDWTHEQFARAIYNEDYVKVDGEYLGARPRRQAADMSRRLHGCEHARILDYGSGAGIFVDAMRDLGFRDIVAYDPFSSPARPAGKFDIVTCFEVIEHTPDPIATVQDMRRFLRDDGCILFGQTVQPPDILERRGSWWYLAPRNGHISTYTRETLNVLGRRLGFTLHASTHLFGLATPAPSSFASHGLAGVGPAFEVLRLYAPATRPADTILFRGREGAVWHPVEDDDGRRRFRWTGAATLSWEAAWPRTGRLQVRIPVLHEVRAGFADSAEIEMNGVRRKAELDAGDLTAEFDVAGRSGGTVVLHTRTPMPPTDQSGAGPRGLAVPLGQGKSPNLAAAVTGRAA